MSPSVNQEIANMLTELIFRFYSACQRHPGTTPGPKIHSHGFHILYLLERSQEKRLSMSFLLTELQMTKQQLSKLVNELEDLDMIERERVGHDRRNVFIHLTAYGSTYFLECAKSVSAHIERALDSQPQEKTDIIHDLLIKLMQNE